MRRLNVDRDATQVMFSLSTSNGKIPSELKSHLAIHLKDYFHEQRNPYNQSMLIKKDIGIELVCHPISQTEVSAVPNLKWEKSVLFQGRRKTKTTVLIELTL